MSRGNAYAFGKLISVGSVAHSSSSHEVDVIGLMGRGLFEQTLDCPNSRRHIGLTQDWEV